MKKKSSTQNYYKYLNGTRPQNQHIRKQETKRSEWEGKKEYLCILMVD